jgi:hypothetical protein
MFLFSSLFIIQFFFFFFGGARGQSVQGTMLIYLRGGCGNTKCHLFVHLLVCWMFHKQVRSLHLAVREPSCFLSVMWHGEALYRLVDQGVKVLILLGDFFFCQVWLQCVSKSFDLWSPRCLLHTSRHLRSSESMFFTIFLYWISEEGKTIPQTKQIKQKKKMMDTRQNYRFGVSST